MPELHRGDFSVLRELHRRGSLVLRLQVVANAPLHRRGFVVVRLQLGAYTRPRLSST